MTSWHGSSRVGFQLAQVGRFTFALIVGALFGIAAWESPAQEAQGVTASPARWHAPDGAIAYGSQWMLDKPAAPSDGSTSALAPIGEAAGNKSHKKQQAAAAMPLRWSIDDESISSRGATAQGGEITFRTTDLHSRGPPSRLANRSDDAQRADQSPDLSGD
ncbi:hypothetical protein RAS2_32460 [Phycisphaerae bacterium RAS2]|nr:hypothetical protein RAS2_32460 [Phycisphaerae bacterium RAS2]